MLKQKRQLFEGFFIIADLLVISAAWIVAYWLRFETDFLIPADKGVPAFSNYFSMLLFIWVIWVAVFRRMGLYRAMRGVRRLTELMGVVQGNILALLLLMSLTYLLREKTIPFSRLVFVYFGVIGTVFLVLERSLLRFLLREIRRQGYNVRYMLLVGAGKLAGDIAARVRLHRELGIQLIGCLSRDGTDPQGPKGVPVLGSYDSLRDLLKTKDIDQVALVLPLEDSHRLPDLMAQIGDSLVDVKFIPDLQEFVSVGGSIEEFEGMPVIGLQSSPVEGMNLVAKRALDVVLASTALLVLSPVLILIALLIRCTSRGPILYWQERVSLDGSRFSIVKFRTMYMDAESAGPQWSRSQDDRIMPLGRFLRTWSLDELPQLVNVLRGDMSLVGPRPERPVFIEEFRQRVPRYMLRHKVPAGMTGWAQVNGWRGDTSIDKRIEYDLFYIQNWSLLLDIRIMWLTITRGIRDRSAA